MSKDYTNQEPQTEGKRGISRRRMVKTMAAVPFAGFALGKLSQASASPHRSDGSYQSAVERARNAVVTDELVVEAGWALVERGPGLDDLELMRDAYIPLVSALSLRQRRDNP